MSKWKCEICNKEFLNFHAQGFDGKVYCPLCYFQEDSKRLKEKNKSLYGSINSIKKQNNNRYKAIKVYLKQIETLKSKLEIKEKQIQNITDVINGHIDGFTTINEFGGCNDILEVLHDLKETLESGDKNANN